MRTPPKPDKIIDSLDRIPLELLTQWGIKGIILDVDNTLLARTSSHLSPEIVRWVQQVKAQFQVILLSNSSAQKIQRVALPLQLPYVAWAMKPISYFFMKTSRKMNLHPTTICMIGDQLFTDIQGAKNCNMRAIWVRPIAPGRDLLWTKMKRARESYWIDKWNCELSLQI